MYQYIINPNNLENYKINSQNSKKLLKKYINNFNKKGSSFLLKMIFGSSDSSSAITNPFITGPLQGDDSSSCWLVSMIVGLFFTDYSGLIFNTLFSIDETSIRDKNTIEYKNILYLKQLLIMCIMPERKGRGGRLIESPKIQPDSRDFVDSTGNFFNRALESYSLEKENYSNLYDALNLNHFPRRGASGNSLNVISLINFLFRRPFIRIIDIDVEIDTDKIQSKLNKFPNDSEIICLWSLVTCPMSITCNGEEYLLGSTTVLDDSETHIISLLIKNGNFYIYDNENSTRVLHVPKGKDITNLQLNTELRTNRKTYGESEKFYCYFKKKSITPFGDFNESKESINTSFKVLSDNYNEQRSRLISSYTPKQAKKGENKIKTTWVKQIINEDEGGIKDDFLPKV